MNYLANLQTSQLLTDNVITPELKIPSEYTSDTYQSFNASDVNLNKATGRFNSVVEISADHCFEVFQNDFGIESYSFPFDINHFTTLLNNGETFTSYALNSIGFKALLFNYEIQVELIPISLTFLENHKLKFLYKANLTLDRLRIGPEVLQIESQIPYIDKGDPEIFNTTNTHFEMRAKMQTNKKARSSKTKNALQNLRMNDVSLASYADKTIPVKHTNFIGSLTITVECEYKKVINQNAKTVDVYAMLQTSVITLNVPDGDLLKLYKNDLFGVEGMEFKTPFLSNSDIKIAPTVSPFGKNNPYPVAPDLARFDVAVFPVKQTYTLRQALAIAINIKSGCTGIIEDVEHFIGNYNFGVISDEYITEKLFEWKWHIGGFKRSISLKKIIQLKKDGAVQNATMIVALALNSLDTSLFETNSDTRKDQIRLGGQATATPQHIILNDGHILSKSDIQNSFDPHFGDPSPMRWSIITYSALNHITASDPELEQFNIKAHTDAYRHLARPFSHFIEGFTQMTYSRLEAVSRHIYFLGNITQIFL